MQRAGSDYLCDGCWGIKEEEEMNEEANMKRER